MTLFALTKSQEAGGQIALAAVLGIAGVFLLLPRPRGRRITFGIAACIAAVAVFAAWVYRTFGNPLPDIIGTVLFWFFSAGALIFGTTLVVQKNPARGAIAFAFVILSTCGLFLLLAAPFLMAATIIIYAGAIIVTFLFVLMLSRADGPSDENDRSREPLYGSFAGFAFVGLVLFALYQTSPASMPADVTAKRESRLPAQVLTAEERQKLADAIPKLEAAEQALDGDVSSNLARDQRLVAFENEFTPAKNDLVPVVGAAKEDADVRDGSIRARLEKTSARGNSAGEFYRSDLQARDALKQAKTVRDLTDTLRTKVENHLRPDKPTDKPDVDAAKAEVRRLRDAVVLFSGVGQLPARNVASLGFSLYSEHLLAIELAGTLLLVATIGAVAISHRKGVAK
jgi:NADH:ubiquinone oxidoreductase subunit 6 (subunit J)